MNISKHQINKIYLDDANINSATFRVTYTIVNEYGTAILDETEKELEKQTTEFDASKNQFFAKFKLSQTKQGKYFRLSFDIVDGEGNYVQSDSALIDLVLDNNKSVMLVPISYFKEYLFSSSVDEEIKKNLDNYPDNAVKEYLQGAQGDLENELELSFVPIKVELENHDFFFENFRDTFWMIQLYNYPVISIESYELYYGEVKIFEIDTTKLQLKKEMGVIEYLPTSDDPFFVLHSSLPYEATEFALVHKGLRASALPNVFRVSYTHGIDFLNITEIEQSSIRTAIARRATLKLLPRIAPEVIAGSEQMSVDGASYARFNRGIEWLNMELQSEVEWIDKMKRKYNKHIKVITA